jgi:hypothetical protein
MRRTMIQTVTNPRRGIFPRLVIPRRIGVPVTERFFLFRNKKFLVGSFFLAPHENLCLIKGFKR